MMGSDLIDKAKPGPTFDAESMRAIRDGRKTQTRRIVRNEMLDHAAPQRADAGGDGYVYRLANGCTVTGKLPYRVGGVYYARESLVESCGLTAYAADGRWALDAAGGLVRWPWKCRVLAPHCMPHWAARVFLRITGVRVQRLGEITDFDAAAEGCWSPLRICGSSVKVFSGRWEQVNKPGSWERDRNKWVAACTFEVLKPEGV